MTAENDLITFLEETGLRLDNIQKKSMELRGPSKRDILFEEVARELEGLDVNADAFSLSTMAEATRLVSGTLEAIRNKSVPFSMQFMVMLFRYVSQARRYMAAIKTGTPNPEIDIPGLEELAKIILDRQSSSSRQAPAAPSTAAAQPPAPEESPPAEQTYAPQDSPPPTDAQIFSPPGAVPLQAQQSEESPDGWLPPAAPAITGQSAGVPKPPPSPPPPQGRPRGILTASGTVHRLEENQPAAEDTAPGSSSATGIPQPPEPPHPQYPTPEQPVVVSTPDQQISELQDLLDNAPKVTPNLRSAPEPAPLMPLAEEDSGKSGAFPPPPPLPQTPPLPEKEVRRRETVMARKSAVMREAARAGVSLEPLEPPPSPPAFEKPASGEKPSETRKTKVLMEIEELLDQADMQRENSSEQEEISMQESAREPEKIPIEPLRGRHNTPLPGTLPPRIPPERIEKPGTRMVPSMPEPFSLPPPMTPDARMKDKTDSTTAVEKISDPAAELETPEGLEQESKAVNAGTNIDAVENGKVEEKPSPTPDEQDSPRPHAAAPVEPEIYKAAVRNREETPGIELGSVDTDTLHDVVLDIHGNLELLASSLRDAPRHAGEQLAYLRDLVGSLLIVVEETRMVEMGGELERVKQWAESRAASRNMNLAIKLGGGVKIDRALAPVLCGLAEKMLEIALFTGLPPRGAQAIRLAVTRGEGGEIRVRVEGLPGRTGIPLGMRLGVLSRRVQPIGGRIELKGRTLEAILPSNCSGLDVLVARVEADELLAVPAHHVVRDFQVSAGSLTADGDGLMRAPTAGNLSLLLLAGTGGGEDESRAVLEVEAGVLNLGLVVEEVIGAAEMVFLRSMNSPGALGVVYDFDRGAQIPVLDVPALLWEMAATGDESGKSGS